MPSTRSAQPLVARAVAALVLLATVALSVPAPYAALAGGLAALAFLIAVVAGSHDTAATATRTAAVELLALVTPARGGRHNAHAYDLAA